MNICNQLWESMWMHKGSPLTSLLISRRLSLGRFLILSLILSSTLSSSAACSDLQGAALDRGEDACRPGLEPEGGVLPEAKKPPLARPGSARLVTTPGAWM